MLMKHHLFTDLKQSGDTIIEVLICMAIISLVLGGAFVTSRNSQLAVRNSQEHGEALKLLEGQIEQMRAAAIASPSTIFQTAQFCMYQGGAVPTTGATAPDCVQQSDGSQAGTLQPAYKLTIKCQGVCPDANSGWLFKASVSWEQVTASGQANETLYYRLYNK